MADRPIIFSGPMVRALLAGRKTMTRRMLKPQPDRHHGNLLGFPDEPGAYRATKPRDGVASASERARFAPGDRLWVRETHRIETWDEDCDVRIKYVADGAVSDVLIAGDNRDAERLIERACDYLDKAGTERTTAGDYESTDALPTRPSVHMPRWASRITLLVTEVKVERLQDINEADARAEGWPGNPDPPYGCHHPRLWFKLLWTDVNSPGSWAANPWVCAVRFRPVLANIDSLPAEAEVTP